MINSSYFPSPALAVMQYYPPRETKVQKDYTTYKNHWLLSGSSRIQIQVFLTGNPGLTSQFL